VDLKRALWRLAFDVHRQSRAGDDEALADIGELQLEKALAELHPERSRDWAAAVVEAMKLRAGLLLERTPEVYTFPHRTFQEYLAGAHLATQANFAAEAVKQMSDPALWWEVILLGAGRLVYLVGDMDKPLALVGELCPQHGADTRQGWKQATLAGDVLREIGLNRVRESALGRDLLERVQARLVDTLATDKLTAQERALAGVTLAKLGDPRREVTTVEHMPFCLAPGGPFWMGEGKEQHRCDAAPADFWISRYPVTNAQHSLFVAAGGYGHEPYWLEAKQSGFWQPGGFKGYGDESWRTGPLEFREPFGLPNHPVVGVTWYEALAFTRWLTDHLHAKALLAPGWAIQLPSEAEWEKAARGGWQVAAPPVMRSPAQGLQATVALVESPNQKRTYPWLGDINPERANYAAAKIGATNAVGCFPSGVSPYGAEEVSGNVWEWTCSLYGEYPYPASGKELLQRENLAAGPADRRVLRGGSFDADENYVRCAARDWVNPGRGNVDVGFRVCAAPLPLVSGASGL
jgi:formylglycine-generating enzyme required for sulfatase activity